MPATRPVAEGLFTWPPDGTQPTETRLIAARCAGCALVTFPAGSDCPRCGAAEARPELLPTRGTLWTFTTQDFRPPSPPYDGNDRDTFLPYAIGYVALSDEILVEGRLTEADPRALRIGQSMDTTLIAYSVDPDGTEVMTFAFAPVGAGRES